MRDPKLCPRCGARNSCTQAENSKPGQPCWCFEVSIAAKRLAAIPQDALGKACLCPRCAGATGPKSVTPDES